MKKKYKYTVFNFNPRTKRVETEANCVTKEMTVVEFKDHLRAEMKKPSRKNSCFDYAGSLK